MSRGALLIDWENVRTSLNSQNYFQSDKTIIGGLILAAETALAERGGVRLGYLATFAPDNWNRGELNTAVRESSGSVKFAIVPSATAKNAADTTLIVHACRLFWIEGYTHFIIVSGDVDYLPLAEEMRREQGDCQLWAVDEKKTSSILAKDESVRYVPKLLKLVPESEPNPDDAQTFLMLCQRWIDSGKPLWNPNDSITGMAEWGIFNRETLEHLNSQAVNQGRFGQDLVTERGRVWSRRRLAYEDRHVRGVFRAVDIAIDRVHRGERSRDRACPKADVISSLEGVVGGGGRAQAELIHAMIRAGYLREQLDNLTLAMPVTRYGTVRALLRLALLVWQKCEMRDWSCVTQRFVHEGWEGYFRPGGNLTDAERAQSAEDATAMLARGVYAGILAKAKNPKGAPAYALVRGNPVVEEAVRIASGLLHRLSAKGGNVTEDVAYSFLEDMNVLGADRSFWLGALAGSRLISWRQRTVQLRRDNVPRRLME